MTLGDFKKKNGGGYRLVAAEDIPGFFRQRQSMYGNCDDMLVDHYLYNQLNGIYTVWLKSAK